ncbi:hypothetical protein SAMN04488136_11623 [Vibrio xiamenensis]|uniref:Uncharacterized protein n=1 Tax=Vibrio xiamenensis TaxID=861298 RepID=A0A1G8CED0_9VIBR|nr:hypothetical protein [Vibrio xiamenensis]SDH43805.1 hypothetical protein SAMN04488136_11623 [Vibrio xiamenensis]
MAYLNIGKQIPLRPLTEDEVMEYVYYVLYHCDYLSQVGRTGISPDRYCDHMDEDGRELVLNSHLWQEFKFVWEYAEKGLHADEITQVQASDLISGLYKYAGLAEVVLLHDGDFGLESRSVSYAGTIILYKFMARLKLDFNWDMEDVTGAFCLFPMAHDTELTTVEYALLAGFSSHGAVRNEISSKTDPLKATKVGKTLLISVDEARKRLPRTRNYIPTKGVTHA